MTPSTGRAVGDGDAVDVGRVGLRFARTDHPPPTVAVEISHDDHRLVYTSDTGPKWSVEHFAPNADLVLSEATYQHDDIRVAAAPLRRVRPARWPARPQARRLVLTHLWPGLDPNVSVAEGSDAFGAPVTLAAPNLTVTL